MSKQYKVGLALSGGAIRGVAHIGVLRVMEKMGIKPDIIAGVSAGAIVGALYADGMKISEMREFFKKSSVKNRFSFTGFKRLLEKYNQLRKVGKDISYMSLISELIQFDSYRKYLEKHLKAKEFSDLNIPLIVNATDLQAGNTKYFCSGPLLDPVVASASVPFVFEPVVIDGKCYVDGGILCNLPAQVLRDKCDLVIGVHCNPIWPDPESTKYWGMKSAMNLADRTVHLAVNGNTAESKKFCDLVIEMKRDQEVGMLDASKCDYLFSNGYESAVQAFKDFDFSKFGIEIKKL